MKRLVYGAIALPLFAPAPLHAQTRGIDDLKGRIFDARMTKQTFANGLKFCEQLDGKTFYFPPRDRVLNLEEYHRALDSLVLQRAFNPQTRRPWDERDADARWAQVQQEAAKDKADCALVANLPELEKELQELEKKAGTAEKKN